MRHYVAGEGKTDDWPPQSPVSHSLEWSLSCICDCSILSVHCFYISPSFLLFFVCIWSDLHHTHVYRFSRHSPSTADGDKEDVCCCCCWWCWLLVLSCWSLGTVLSILSPAPSLSSTSAVLLLLLLLFTVASVSAAPLAAACMVVCTNTPGGDGAGRLHCTEDYSAF